MSISAADPIYLVGLGIKTSPQDLRETLALWPEDLRWMVGFQVIDDAHDPLPGDQRAAALDEILDATDDLGVPTMLQVGTFLGWHGPTPTELDRAFGAHPSFAGVTLAELSAGSAAITGLTDDQKAMVADTMVIAVRNDAHFLWADMGYVGPHVFVGAGADRRIVDLMAKHPQNMIIQAKQNGLGRRFGTWSAAFGFYAAGLANNWGVNSEDWLWWEASLAKLYDPQVPGGLTAAGAIKSDAPNKARLTYPESLFGTEFLVAASEGASVYSLESPARILDLTDHKVGPVATQVIFPVLRALTGDRLIAERATVRKHTPVAYQPGSADPPELAFDQVFSGLYGPEGCTTADQVACSQRQWLPSTGRYGLIPTIPLLSGPAQTAHFTKVLRSLDGTDADRRQHLDPHFDAAATGTSWAAPGPTARAWFVANPNENLDSTSTFGLPVTQGASISGTLPPHAFGIITTEHDEVHVLVDNYRASSDPLWDEDQSDPDPAVQSAGPPAPAATTTLRLQTTDSANPKVRSTGGTVTTTWDQNTHQLVITISHRGPVEIDVSW